MTFFGAAVRTRVRITTYRQAFKLGGVGIDVAPQFNFVLAFSDLLQNDDVAAI